MAMTKAEQQEVARLKHELALAKALRFTDPVESDIAPPANNEIIINGWSWAVYQGEYSVMKACTSSTRHSKGIWDKARYPGPRHLYSTELLATRAARSDLARRAAQELAQMDARIAELEGA